MLGTLEQRGGLFELDDLALGHHRDPVRDHLDQREVVRDEEVGDPALLLEVLEQVQHLGPHRHVERGDRFVADDHLGLQGECPRDRDALELATRQLRREPPEELGIRCRLAAAG